METSAWFDITLTAWRTGVHELTFQQFNERSRRHLPGELALADVHDFDVARAVHPGPLWSPAGTLLTSVDKPREVCDPTGQPPKAGMGPHEYSRAARLSE